VTRTALVRTDRYSRGAIALHWTIAVLVLANLALGLFHESLLDGLKWVIPAHKALGITVLALTLARIGWRMLYRPPPFPPEMPRWERVTAKAAHGLLYVLLLALPLSGWAMVSAGEERRPLSWFGLFRVPWLPVSDAASDAADRAHLVAGYLMAALVVVHIAAALRHHFILRDSVFARMVPGLARGD